MDAQGSDLLEFNKTRRQQDAYWSVHHDLRDKLSANDVSVKEEPLIERSNSMILSESSSPHFSRMLWVSDPHSG